MDAGALGLRSHLEGAMLRAKVIGPSPPSVGESAVSVVVSHGAALGRGSQIFI